MYIPKSINNISIGIAVGIILALSYALWSYSLTDPNLVVTSWTPYWSLQQWLWQTIWHQPQLLTVIFQLLIGLLFCWYFWMLTLLSKVKSNSILLTVGWLLIVGVFTLSQNALSHDIYNYIFNAKMVLQYHVDPHVATALQFPDDAWTRFMHNTHTAAPYGYGWTLLSLLPSILGTGRFMFTWFLFKLFNLAAAVLLFAALQRLSKQIFHQDLSVQSLAVIAINPLFLIEVFGNGHNDLWMMMPILWSFSYLIQFISTKKWTQFCLAVCFLLASLSTKFATLATIPVWLLLLISGYFPTNHKVWLVFKELINKYWPTIASLLLFLPLLTARSQQFHPWYLIWILVWIPLIRNKYWSAVIISLSISSMLRYTPWLQNGEYSELILSQQKMITWLLPILCLIIWYWYAKKPTQKT